MSWSNSHDPEEEALRSELQDLLGMRPSRTASPTSDEAPQHLIQLADRLYLEAQRRKHTVRPLRTRQLLAASLVPLFVGLAALGYWGFQQKQRADQMAQALRERDTQLVSFQQRYSQDIAKERALREQVQQHLVLAAQKLEKKGEPFLVVPIERPVTTTGPETSVVKQK